MNIYISQLLIVAGIHALAVISPGPDFVLVSKYSMSYSRRIGIASALGVALGIGVHVVYCVLGVGALIASSILLFNFIKWVGALYLIYIGAMSLFAKKVSGNSEIKTVEIKDKETKDITFIEAIRVGFLTNVLNPKATLFFLAVFTQIITPGTPKWIQAIYGIEMIFVTAVWFSIVALCLSTPYMSRKIEKMKGAIDKVTGLVLIALGLRIMLE